MCTHNLQIVFFVLLNCVLLNLLCLDFADKTHSSVVVGARVESSGAVAVVVVVRFCLKMQPAMDTGARGGRTGGL